MEEVTIRRARPEEAAELSELAMRSKAVWGYSEEFMEACRDELTLSPEYVRTTPTFVVGERHGFYALDRLSETDVELAYLFVEPDAIGHGYGRILMNHAKAEAEALGYAKMVIQGDPNADRFYRAAGCRQVGEKESGSIPGRFLPLFELDLGSRKQRVKIREARRDDVAAIVGMLADDKLGQGREQALDPLPEAYLEAFEAIDGDPRHLLLIAELDGEPVGTLQLSFLPYLTYGGGWRAQIEAVRAASELRGAGIGAQLVEWAIARAREHGCHLVQLTTDKQRPDALRFYERLGFRSSHEGMKLHLEDRST